MTFCEFGLKEPINKALTELGLEKPTQIQEKVIPLVLEKFDVMAKAQTGSGKTASFILPILENFLNNPYEGKAKIRTLVLAPTRELALQVSNSFQSLSKYFNKKPKITTIIGGEDISQQLLDVQKGSDIVVATAGRLLDIISKKQINLSNLEYFVLDEADKLLDLGFSEELDLILEQIPRKRQNLLFSATYPPKVLEIASKITKEAKKVFLEQSQTVELINQRAIKVNSENRSALLRYLLKEHNWDKVLVFMATNRAADNLAAKFRKYGFNAESFHGHLDQEERNYTLEDFKNKEIDILFSSDIAARGLHIEDISCVVNYDLPRSPADYVHRIGRTARAGKSGDAISFITLENYEHFKLIEKRSNINLEKEVIKGFELEGTPVTKKKGEAPVKGKRKSKKDKLREARAKKDNL
ncbi:DEAD/DEAH box helicase [Halarcobacter bivalviorum]|uniref:DEAD/DEAH box helicase n=1 Tax=Halarcobacter bivalviorum TaxID=663364 RepID=UPI00100A39F8|nr:DEAD/DEAH box helicase [Halarcobacter bivalviorum]RXK08215.1 DEAD/DEAH box helicase [Halarcobacter bivalviorum]